MDVMTQSLFSVMLTKRIPKDEEVKMIMLDSCVLNWRWLCGLCRERACGPGRGWLMPVRKDESQH